MTADLRERLAFWLVDGGTDPSLSEVVEALNERDRYRETLEQIAGYTYDVYGGEPVGSYFRRIAEEAVRG